METRIIAKFGGDYADDNILPAYEGTQSLTGLSRSLILTGHFISTGVIRKRAPFTEQLEIYLLPPRPGSWESIFEVIANSKLQAFGGAVAERVTSSLFADAVKTVWSRVIGRDRRPETATLQELEEKRPGDLDALADAIEPAARQSHTVIGQGAKNIIIISGDNNVVNFNSNSKEYVSSTIVSEREEVQDVSVGSLNANSGYGRAFFSDLGKTVPFWTHGDADEKTIAALAHSLNRYANSRRGERRDSYVQVRFRRKMAPDGRTKSIIIYEARIPGD